MLDIECIKKTYTIGTAISIIETDTLLWLISISHENRLRSNQNVVINHLSFNFYLGVKYTTEPLPVSIHKSTSKGL